MSRKKKSASKSSSRKKSKKRRKSSSGQREKNPAQNKHDFSTTLGWFLGAGNIFSQLKFHGNTKWEPRNLVTQALLFSWSEKDHVTDGFSESVKRCGKLGSEAALTTYQGFMEALASTLSVFMPLLFLRLQKLMQEIGGSFWQVADFVPIAFDGGRSDAPRTESNEEEFCAANYGNGRTAKYRKKKTRGMRRTKNEKHKAAAPKPQAWITMMWHMGLRLPWSWRLGPSNSSERAHVVEMLSAQKFPENTLFCGDAGFVGYELWKLMLDQGHDFLIRVGGNVKLLCQNMEYQRLKDGCVYCWPLGKRGKKAPLRLRLVQIRVGKAEMFLLTSVLESQRLDRQATERSQPGQHDACNLQLPG